MIKTTYNREKGKTTVVLKNEGADPFVLIYKRFQEPRIPEIPREFVGVASLHPNDTFDEAEGQRVALDKAVRKKQRAFWRAIIEWQSKMIRAVYRVFPDTFDKSLNDALKKIEAEKAAARKAAGKQKA